MNKEPAKFVVIGSAAMKFHFPEFRNPNDVDVIVRRADLVRINKNKGGITSEKWNPNGLSCIVKYDDTSEPFEYLFADGNKAFELILDQLADPNEPCAQLQVLYSIKKAHIHYPIKFNKHIKDYMFLREKLREKRGITLEKDINSQSDLLDGFPGLTDMLVRETEKRLGALRTPKMAQSTKQFFGKSKKFVESYYIHDNMHLAMAHDQDPVYLQILKDGAEVETDINKWSELTTQQKIWCVLEETYVIALERKILPSLFERNAESYTEKEAFDWSLMRVCTTLCDGFFREFAVRAYDEIQKAYDPNYVKVFFKNINKYENQKENRGRNQSGSSSDIPIKSDQSQENPVQ